MTFKKVASKLSNIADEIEYGDTEPQADERVPSRDVPSRDYNCTALNREYALVLWGGRAVVVKEPPNGQTNEQIRVLSVDAFDHWHSNCFTEVRGADGRLRPTTWARAWRGDPARRQFSGIEFFPNPDGAEGTENYLNLWRGFGVQPSKEGSWNIFRDHLLTNICRGDKELFEWVFAWFAHIFQRPRERIGTALVLRGQMGCGKSKVGEVFGSLIPAHYVQVDDPRYIVGQFNAHQASCLLLQAEEAVWAGDKHAEGRLKGLCTSETQMIESKGVDPIRIRNYLRLLMTSNEHWVVPAGMNERRFCVLDVHPGCAQNHDYFREMQTELDQGGLQRLLYDLLGTDLSKVNLRQIPRTVALLEQKIRSLDPLTGWWFYRLMAGTSTRTADDWGCVTVEALYADYVQTVSEQGSGWRLDRSSFGLRLRDLAPGIRKPRLRAGDEKRIWSYQLPSLQQCRDVFAALLGHDIEWNEALANAESHSSDDEVPA